jgi:phosphopantothenoylcysteine synthetase/decarboxylase
MKDRQLTFIILSGPTREYIDPVRFISNESSGKMGKALCEVAIKKKHRVIFITGPAQVLPKADNIIKVISADDMFKVFKTHFSKANIVISAAAIADFKPEVFNAKKIKKNNKHLTLKLIKNPDIIAYAASKRKKQVIAGFSLETHQLLENAKSKLKNKNLDLIVANSNKALNADKSNAVIIKKEGRNINLKNASKKLIAEVIINETISIFRNIISS